MASTLGFRLRPNTAALLFRRNAIQEARCCKCTKDSTSAARQEWCIRLAGILIRAGQICRQGPAPGAPLLK
jgi:hypothetical protein